MDKTVRLWHIDRDECLCSFEVRLSVSQNSSTPLTNRVKSSRTFVQHLDFVTSIAFHPKDDRFFLSGSLDCKLRLWNIVEKRVQVRQRPPSLLSYYLS